MKSLAFITDDRGEIVPLGSHRITKTWDFLDGTIPAGLTVSQGTASFFAPSFTNGSFRSGHVTVMSAATVDSRALLETALGFHTSHYEGILWEVDGLMYDVAGPNAEISIGINGSGSSGGYALQRATDPGMRLYSANQFEAVNYNKRDGTEARRRVSLGIGISQQFNEVVLFESGQPIHVRDATGLFNAGVVKPNVGVITKEAVSHGFSVVQCRLTLWQT